MYDFVYCQGGWVLHWGGGGISVGLRLLRNENQTNKDTFINVLSILGGQVEHPLIFQFLQKSVRPHNLKLIFVLSFGVVVLSAYLVNHIDWSQFKRHLSECPSAHVACAWHFGGDWVVLFSHGMCQNIDGVVFMCRCPCGQAGF